MKRVTLSDSLHLSNPEADAALEELTFHLKSVIVASCREFLTDDERRALDLRMMDAALEKHGIPAIASMLEHGLYEMDDAKLRRAVLKGGRKAALLAVAEYRRMRQAQP